MGDTQALKKKTHSYLVGRIPTPLKNMSSSFGMMKFPTEWKNNSHVPNHQPEMVGVRWPVIERGLAELVCRLLTTKESKGTKGPDFVKLMMINLSKCLCSIPNQVDSQLCS